jgi:hypothetical protein
LEEETMSSEQWPGLPFAEWKDTCATLHMWTQIVGKVRLALTPWLNHSWHATLYVTSRGLTTSPIPYGARSFEIDFDLIDHKLVIDAGAAGIRTLALAARPVAEFYREVFAKLGELDINVRIYAKPNEVVNCIPFENDYEHTAYDPSYANRFWQALSHADRVLKRFRSRFVGKSSPVHFFWGSFDLAVTRFSGRLAPQHPGGVPHLPDWVTREAYSHEVASCGFWPGGEQKPEALFYAYAYPEPDRFTKAKVAPRAAVYDDTLREFLLPYEEVRTSATPDETLLEFLQSTYEAAADCGKWDRAALERSEKVKRAA